MVLFPFLSDSEYRSFADSSQVKPLFFLKKKKDSTESLSLSAKYDTYRIKADCSRDGLMITNLQSFSLNNSWVKL